MHPPVEKELMTNVFGVLSPSFVDKAAAVDF